jgi:hypothetical protein
MKKDKSEVKTHTVAQVDAENAMSFIDGYAHGFGVFMGACEKSLRALDTVMASIWKMILVSLMIGLKNFT